MVPDDAVQTRGTNSLGSGRGVRTCSPHPQVRNAPYLLLEESRAIEKIMQACNIKANTFLNINPPHRLLPEMNPPLQDKVLRS